MDLASGKGWSGARGQLSCHKGGLVRRLLVALLAAACAGLSLCGSLRCQSETGSVEDAIAQLELNQSGALKPGAPLERVLSRDAEDIVAATERIYRAGPGRDLGAKAAATLVLLADGRQLSPALKDRMACLAEQMLFDQDRLVADSALQLLFIAQRPRMEELVIRRLRALCTGDTLTVILRRCVDYKLYGVLRDQISLPPPLDEHDNSYKDWRNRIEATLSVCLSFGALGEPLPAGLASPLLDLVSQDADQPLQRIAVVILAETRPEGVVAAAKARLDEATALSTRVALETTALILDSGDPALAAASLRKLADAAQRCSSDPNLRWEAVLRTKWLALACVYRSDDSLLKGIWASIGCLEPPLKGELLSVVVSQHTGNFSSERTSTNRLILFLDALPRDDLRRMATQWPNLRSEIGYLLSQSADSALPNLITRGAMDAAIQRFAQF